VENKGQGQGKEKNTNGTPFDDPQNLLANDSKVKPMANATKLE
jgi:hypothetical protein